MSPILLAGLRDYRGLAEKIRANLWQAETLQIETSEFPDGERYHRLRTPVLNADVVLVCGTPTDAHFMDLLDVACAAAKYGARTLTLIIPYLGYSTMERSTKPGEVVKAKIRARMLSAIPSAKNGNSALFLDLHSEGIPYYTEGNLTAHHLYSEPVLIAAIARLRGKTPLCIASTDAGRAKWVQSIANQMGALPAFCVKTRLSGSKTKLEAASTAVAGHHAVIFDDMIRTGGSLLDAVNAYDRAGAVRIDVACTHGIFPGESLQKVLAHPKIGRLLVSDSVPSTLEKIENLPAAVQERIIPMDYASFWAEAIKTQLETS